MARPHKSHEQVRSITVPAFLATQFGCWWYATHNWIKAGIIMRTIEELQDVELFGATIKFKLDYTNDERGYCHRHLRT